MLKAIKKKRIVPYSSHQMFDLVDDIEQYPSFLPWCRKSHIHKRTNKEVEASLIVGFRGIDKTFSTRNILERPREIEIQLIDGPFRSLNGLWGFSDINKRQSEIKLNLQFEILISPLSHFFESFFEQIVNSQISAFENRAKSLYSNNSKERD